MKIGVISPLYNRPDFARFLALQLENQSMRPHLVAFHQDGTPDSYEWVIKDIDRHYESVWLHTPNQIVQDEWYAIPLEHLINAGCTHFFWCDHDDIYHRNHIANGVDLLDSGYDHVVNQQASLLLLKAPYEYHRDFRFTAHDPGGMSSSMCFNRKFAEALLKDLRANLPYDQGGLGYSDQVVNRVTMPKFNCIANPGSPTTTYVCHPKTVSSSHWLDQ